MVREKDVAVWLNSEVYRELLKFVEKKLLLNINHCSLPEILYSYDEDDINLAGVDIVALDNISRNKELCAEYVSEKLRAISGTENVQEGKCEEDDEDDEDEIIEDFGFYSNFLNGYLLELYFLLVKPDSLEAYLKAIRVPHGKKYAVQLRSVLEKIS